MTVILAAATLTLFSCGKNDILLSDLLGTWIFQNTMNKYADAIDAELTVRMNSDYTIHVASIHNQNMQGFGFSGKTFRMLITYPIYGTHMVWRQLWEGELDRNGLLAGKLFIAKPYNQPLNIMNVGKEEEIGTFFARRISD
jgi:hypothetical protein